MDIHNGSLYWPTTFPLRKPFEVNERSDCYDVVIVGGGMSGALSALALTDAGLSVAILDKRQMATGSTMVNTGFIQYSNDIMLHELIDQIGERDAVRYYQMCLEAVKDLETISNRLPITSDFIVRPSICFASSDADVKKIKEEYETLRKHGFPCDYWTPDEMSENVSFTKPGAFVTYEDAEMNPYRLVNGILELIEEKGTHLFDFVEVTDSMTQEDCILIKTTAGTFNAKHIIYTTGYETTPVGKRIGAKINRSYAVVTKPIDQITQWYQRAFIWETARPYLYIRTTTDNRIIVGGLDEEIAHAPKSLELINEKAEKLLIRIQELFPHFQIELDYAYGATFGESKDNMPFIGQHPTKKNHYYLLGYGGNGTVYSMFGSQILRDLIIDGHHPDAHLVQLDRKYGVK